MPKQIVLICILVLTGWPALAQQADRSHAPQTRSRSVDIKHIDIDLRFDWKKRQAYGSATIRLAPLQATQQVSLDAGMLAINRISVGKSVLKFQYDGSDRDNNLVITLDRKCKAGEDVTIRIDYRTNHINETDPLNLGGSNGKGGLRFIWPTPAEPTRKKQIWSLGEPQSNRYWFPGYDHPGDFRTTAFHATVEKELMVIANGKLTRTQEHKDGTHTFHYTCDTPHANQNTTFVVGTYADVRQSYKDVTLHSYSYTNEIEGTTASVERLLDMVKFFSDYTGVEYPFGEYAQVFVQDLPWGVAGMGIAAQSENMVDDYDTHADYLYLWDGLEGESLARQWFGSYVTAGDWSHTWLNKGLSRYFSGLYDSYKNGTDEFLLWQHSFDQSVYLNDWASGVYEPIANKGAADLVSFSSGNAPYYYASAVLRLLHKELGDENWKKTIQLYLQRHAHQPASTQDFQLAVEEANGQSMKWFFDQWFYNIGHPVFEVKKKYDANRKELILAVKQLQKPVDSVSYDQNNFYQGKMFIEIENTIEPIWLDAKEENVFTFSRPQEPSLINFDYQSSWLKEITFEKSVDELLYQLEHSTDVLARQDAMTRLTATVTNDSTFAREKGMYAEVLYHVIQSKAYWRTRLSALAQLRTILVKPGVPARLDPTTKTMLLEIIHHDSSWVKSSALAFLGLTQDTTYADLYIQAMTDKSDRVVNTAAIALGKSKSAKAFQALANLVHRPSWKNQSLMSALSGLQQLGDPRGYDIAYKYLSDVHQPRWNLPQISTGLWDYRVFAAQTIKQLGRSASAYPLVRDRLKKSLKENDLNVIFNNVLLIETLADAQGAEIFPWLKERFKNDKDILAAVAQYEEQFRQATAN